MKFLVLLTVAAILIFTPWRTGYPKDLLKGIVRFALTREKQWTVLLVLLLALVPVGLLLWWLQGWAYGLFTLVVHVGLLLLCVGRHDPLGRISNEFTQLWERGEERAAAELARRHLGLKVDEPELLLATVRGRMVATSLTDYFVPVFWYLLLGPLGALAYRLLYLAREQYNGATPQPASMLAHAFEWIPARLLALSFALVGHFDSTLRTLRGLAADWELAGGELAARCADVASQDTPAQDSAEQEASRVLASTHQLLIRALLAWAVIIAFFAMMG